MYIGGDEVIAHVDSDERWFLQCFVSIIDACVAQWPSLYGFGMNVGYYDDSGRWLTRLGYVAEYSLCRQWFKDAILHCNIQSRSTIVSFA